MVKGMRSLYDIYQRCNVAILEPATFWEAKNDSKWIDAMNEEIEMIEKSNISKLVKRPTARKVSKVGISNKAKS